VDLQDKKQNTLRQKELVPLLIGISLFCVVSLVAPFTQARVTWKAQQQHVQDLHAS
jgi:adenylylsulfate kinase-like enzyme